MFIPKTFSLDKKEILLMKQYVYTFGWHVSRCLLRHLVLKRNQTPWLPEAQASV